MVVHNNFLRLPGSKQRKDESMVTPGSCVFNIQHMPSPLSALHETFSSASPFHLSKRVPGESWKTATAWNGYHYVPLRDSYRHLTTFITPFGIWRYSRAPQGFLSSGDGYNRRFDEIIANFQRKERCIDDTIHWDVELLNHWWRTIDYLILVGRAGVVLNPNIQRYD